MKFVDGAFSVFDDTVYLRFGHIGGEYCQRLLPREQEPKKIKVKDCKRCGAPRWTKQHDCPVKGRKGSKCDNLVILQNAADQYRK